MERRPALLVSTAAAVAFATAGFGYAATNLLTKPAEDQVGRLTVAQATPAPPRPIQYVYDEVPIEDPAPAAQSAPIDAADSSAPMTPSAASSPSPTTTTTTTAVSAPHDESVENQFDAHPEDQHQSDTTQPNDHDADD